MGISIPNPFHIQHHSATQFSPSSMVGITPDGKQALDRMQLSGREYAVMSELDGCTLSISNLSHTTRMPPEAVEMTVKGLRRQGYVAIKDFEQER